MITEHRIETGDARPIRLPPYRLPHAHRDSVMKELREMEEEGLIEPSSSSWAAPIVPVKKKDNTIRVCVDYRRLNAVSHVDAYPMPRIDRLGGARIITTLDVMRGYWQVPVRREDRPKTAFATALGLYQFRVMPFGLQGAPATFQCMMDSLLRGLDSYAAAYLDDVIIHSESWEEHLQHIDAVLTRLRNANLTVKSPICNEKLHVLGPHRRQRTRSAGRSFPTPTSKKQVRTFLGLAGYYRKLIPGFSSTAAPLTDLTRKTGSNKIVWTSDCDRAFQSLKENLCASPILHNPDFTREFILQMDASDCGIGAVLSQLDDTGTDCPVAYYSRKLLPREENYAAVEKECLAICVYKEPVRYYSFPRPSDLPIYFKQLSALRKLPAPSHSY